MTTFSVSELKRINAGLCAGISSFDPLESLNDLELFVTSFKAKSFNYQKPSGVSINKKIKVDSDLVDNILKRNKIVIVCCSGGVDSQTLLHLCMKNQNKKILMALHVNHGLRSDADLEQKLVESVCELYGVPLWSKKLVPDENISSVESWARSHRMAFMDEVKTHIKNTYGEDPVFLTAHHAGDQSETVLMRLIRGTGLVGLQGIRDSHTLKPLLNCNKDSFYSYTKKHNIKLLEDYTNSDITIKRNFIRSNLQNSCDSINDLLFNISANAFEYVHLCEAHALKLFPNIAHIFDISNYIDNSDAVKLRYALNARFDLKTLWTTKRIIAFDSFMSSKQSKLILGNYVFNKIKKRLYIKPIS